MKKENAFLANFQFVPNIFVLDCLKFINRLRWRIPWVYQNKKIRFSCQNLRVLAVWRKKCDFLFFTRIGEFCKNQILQFAKGLNLGVFRLEKNISGPKTKENRFFFLKN